MFNNLKAFIRHGKQANDLRDKADYTYQESTHNKRMEETTESLSKMLASSDSNFGPDVLHSDLEKSTTDSSGYDDERLGRQDRDTYDKNMYTDVANQMVEEERVTRSLGKTYPKLDNYDILEKMGEGAFSVVHKARHVPSGNMVAVKILLKYQMDQAQRSAVMKEVIIMRQVNHPNIVRFIEFIESDTYYYIVQELVAGGEIFAAIVNYTYLSEDLARHIIYQVAKAVRYLHEEVGIVHRDIKPENLLFMPVEFKPSLNPISKLRRSDDPKAKKDEGEFVAGVGGGTVGTVKLADFGLSKQIWEHNTKTPCGTVGYTAPEIVRDERYSKEVDMWAIGCVLYTILCGFPPFYDERIESLTEKVARGEYTFLAPWWDEISSDAKYCVSRLLTVDPKKRYTIEEFFQDPWMQKAVLPLASEPDLSAPAKTHLSKFTNYKQKSELYLPAALALRDAFDISAAVHRLGEEAALLRANGKYGISDVAEEDEEMDDLLPPPKMAEEVQGGFALNLGGASILERRRNKGLAV